MHTDMASFVKKKKKTGGGKGGGPKQIRRILIENIYSYVIASA